MSSMLVKIISLAFHSASGGFSDEELRDFIKDKEVIAINDHLFVRNEIPYLTLIIKYFPLRAETEQKPAGQAQQQRPKGDESWKEGLSEADMGLFNLLRDWRSTQSRKEAVPPYVLATNRQLASMVKKRPQSLLELAKVEGFGKAKIEKYGQEILKIFNVDLGPAKEA